ncbi:MAG: hypothetical protein B7O98_07555 [Zestosphaera tikiterensis]|uniref:Uncharacterized protein n=1 Tax=Zestosphaera tikiterensis TaxID=1973259 RepID=A0A2R7Y541_9CREN|nr:MAG: hypothetical protein B7O98_07555 [Zestosphaera tikiterensis]
MPRWCWRRRWFGVGRPPTYVYVSLKPEVSEFLPKPNKGLNPTVITYPELEALKLVDLENLSYEEAALHMGVSRGTVWRLVRSGRRKVVEALIAGRPISIEPGGELEEVKDSEGGDVSKA